jgi:hypothetical protein
MPAKHSKEGKPLICSCVCPYCEVELAVAESPFCDVCKITFKRCPSCGAVVPEGKSVKCKTCGKPLA